MANIFDQLIGEAKKKKKQFEDNINSVTRPAPKPVAPVTPPTRMAFSDVAKQRIQTRNPSADVSKGAKLPTITAPKRENVFQKAAGGFKEGAPTLGLAAKRVGIGIGQDVSGTYDLISKGTGTNRISKMLDKYAVNTDREAQRRNVTGSYQQTQVPLSLSAFAAPGVAATKVGKIGAVNKIVTSKPVATAARVLNKPVDRVAKAVEKRGVPGRITGAAIRGGAAPASVINSTVGTVSDLGSESGKGRDISKKDVAISAATNIGASAALPAIGRTGQELVTGALPAAKTAAKATGKAVQESQQKLADAANTAAQIKAAQARVKRLMDERKRTDFGSPASVKYDDAIAQTQAEVEELSRVARSEKPGVKDRLLGGGVGLSMRDVSQLPTNRGPENMPGQPMPNAEQLPQISAGRGIDRVSLPDNTPGMPTDLPLARQVPEGRAPTATDFPDERKLNTDRLDLEPDEKQFIGDETTQVVDRLTNDEVTQMAKAAGIDTRTFTTEQTKQVIAKQLNTRRDAVSLMTQARNTTDLNERAALLAKAAERGRESRTQGTDLARQLQARKIIANELDTPEQRIFKLLDEAGVNPEVYSKRFADVDFNNTKQVVEAYRELVPGKAAQWLDTLRYNSMLSSPLTQAVNIFGNAQNVGLVAPIEKTLRGGVDAVRSLATGTPRKYAAGEGAAYAGGVATNIGNAARNFADAFKGTGKYANPDFNDYNMPLATKGVKGGVYKTLSFPMRVLDGMDKFFRTLGEAGEDAALELRDRKGIAIRGNRDALKEGEAAYRVFQTPLGDPGQGTINNALDEFAGNVMKLRNSKNPLVSLPAKFTVPFLTTINNIGKQGIIDYSPLGLANLRGNTNKTTAVTRAIMGSAIFGTSAALIAQGDMTWAEPRDPDERARFRAEGKQPYAVRFGDKWVNFSKLTPSISFPMAMTAALHDAMENGKTDQSTVDKVLESISKYGNFLADQSYAKSVGDTLGAIGGDKEAIASMVANNVQQLVPFRALTGWMARISDDVERKVDTSKGYFDQQVQSLMQQYPGLRQKTATRDYKGEPIAANNQVFNGFSPVRVTKDQGTDPLDAEADQLADSVTESFKLDKRQQRELDTVTAPEIKKMQNQIIKDPRYKELTPDERKATLARVKTDITGARKAELMANQQLGPYAPDYTGKDNKLSTNQKRIVKGETVDFLTKDDDKTFSEKYESALEEERKDSGSWSNVERAKKQREIKSLAVKKDYDEDTVLLYSMGKPQVWDLVSNDPDGQAMVDKLIAYGDALEAAGLGKNSFRNSKGVVSVRPAEKKSASGSKLKPSDFKTPYDDLIQSTTKGAELARSAKLAKKRA